MLSSTRTNKRYATSKGDGNCAFNAFALALYDEAFLRAIEDNFVQQGRDVDEALEGFLEKVSLALKKEKKITWADFKTLYLNSPPDEGQVFLAPILRDLAISHFNQEQASEDMFTSKLLLEVAFDYYYRTKINEEKNVPLLDDDILTTFPFIEKKFSKIVDKKRSQKENFEEVWEWWSKPKLSDGGANHINDVETKAAQANHSDTSKHETKRIEAEAHRKVEASGFQLFLKEMRKNATWAGDLELAKLASYFNISLLAERKHVLKNYLIFNNYGKVSRAKVGGDEQVKALVLRNVLDPVLAECHQVAFYRLSREELEKRLAGLKEEDVSLMTEVFDLDKKTIAKDIFSDLDELIARGVLSRPDKDGNCKLLMSKDDAINSMLAIDNADVIIDAYTRNYKNTPTMVLENVGGHWEPKDTLVPNVSDVSPSLEDKAKVMPANTEKAVPDHPLNNFQRAGNGLMCSLKDLNTFSTDALRVNASTRSLTASSSNSLIEAGEELVRCLRGINTTLAEMARAREQKNALFQLNTPTQSSGNKNAFFNSATTLAEDTGIKATEPKKTTMLKAKP